MGYGSFFLKKEGTEEEADFVFLPIGLLLFDF